ncbi:hypothetical protein SELMODRAFT_442567 [Selaginella moellendorffii]|uniref:Coatomer subunit epsilon n=1 Tax=Selaginella moellendorffii TaxID=88036 RepID=D8RU17_SELML|nr:coatomer subunit epsilon-1 [Selaginella moellendorffii]EFJ24128.1 hypothetical protein SELMODRAFT_442567 [Selaginella moellendorffii]|eukprot:XP_002974608.1 coatomer subunit epsilon-1 [Selaginella moellendorffii]
MALFFVKNNFFLGAYQEAINAAGKLKGLSDQEAAERDYFVYRSYISCGLYQIVIDEIKSSTSALEAVRLLATYFLGEKESAKSSLKDLLADPLVASNNDVLLIAGIIHAHEQDYNEALKYTHAGETLELCALNIHMYIKLNRTERAEQQLKVMQRIDEDHTLTQLANAWVNLALGGSKIQEASYIFQELSEKYSWTVPLMNGRAVCHMHMGQFDDAEQLLLDALLKDNKDADTLANLIVCCLHLGKSTTRHMSQLKSLQPDHPTIQRQVAAETMFQQALQAMG